MAAQYSLQSVIMAFIMHAGNEVLSYFASDVTIYSSKYPCIKPKGGDLFLFEISEQRRG